ncbi:MAG: hypothetical protein CL941_05250 [Desulfobacter sp.]|jgi:putrescine aminotransferase|nr:hypothetical protein [Desulfobacter sp.]|tara:strand:+ start:251 stop:694 length:444 start_codon:yes stop_codon:yes gene_type:complete
MTTSKNKLDETSHLILHLTHRDAIKKGIMVVNKGEGINVYDAEGKKYIDLTAGVTRPVHLGYGNKELAKAIYDQIYQIPYFTPMMFANAPAVELAEVLSETVPGPINRFAFECDGSEAVETAMKLVKHYHYFKGEKGRFKVISRKGA